MIDTFRWLEFGLSVVLVFVGTKMLLEEVLHVPVGVSLGVIGTILTVSIVSSVVWPAPMTDEPVLRTSLCRSAPSLLTGRTREAREVAQRGCRNRCRGSRDFPPRGAAGSCAWD